MELISFFTLDLILFEFYSGISDFHLLFQKTSLNLKKNRLTLEQSDSFFSFTVIMLIHALYVFYISMAHFCVEQQILRSIYL